MEVDESADVALQAEEVLAVVHQLPRVVEEVVVGADLEEEVAVSQLGADVRRQGQIEDLPAELDEVFIGRGRDHPISSAGQACDAVGE